MDGRTNLGKVVLGVEAWGFIACSHFSGVPKPTCTSLSNPDICLIQPSWQCLRKPLRVLVALYTKWQSRRSRHSQGSLGIICLFSSQYFFCPLFWSARFILKSSSHVLNFSVDSRERSILNFSLESVYYCRATLSSHPVWPPVVFSRTPNFLIKSTNAKFLVSGRSPLAGNRNQT